MDKKLLDLIQIEKGIPNKDKLDNLFEQLLNSGTWIYNADAGKIFFSANALKILSID